MTQGSATRYQRLVLPGFALEAMVIGGGYATGRELDEFFLPSGPWGGLAGMLLATVIWSAVSTLRSAATDWISARLKRRACPSRTMCRSRLCGCGTLASLASKLSSLSGCVTSARDRLIT